MNFDFKKISTFFCKHDIHVADLNCWRLGYVSCDYEILLSLYIYIHVCIINYIILL